MRYEDFALQIESRPDGHCRARVIGSPAGEAAGDFALPISWDELDRVAEQVSGVVDRHRQRRRGAPRAAGHPVVEPVAPPQLHDIGARLSRALFTQDVRSRYDHTQGQMMLRKDCGLRLKLHMALDDAATARLHDLPWEYLVRPEDGTFLSLSRNAVVVRYISLPLPAERRLLPLPLRILAVTAAPSGTEALELARELETLHHAWRSVAGVEVVHLTNATLDALREKLLEREFHVLHFMGHGGVDVAGQGVLCFENEHGDQRPVGGPELAQQLRDFSSLRLVVLNACESARTAFAAPFTGVATALLQVGVPAVLAMQFRITDDAALAFSQVFYQRLATGDPVETAVAEGRLAVQRRLQGTLEWGTPVLFLRAQDGRLFLEHGATDVLAAEPLPATVRGPAPPLPTPSRVRGATPAIAATLIALLVAAGSAARWLPVNQRSEPSPSPSATTTPSPSASPQPPVPRPSPSAPPRRSSAPAPPSPWTGTLGDGETVAASIPSTHVSVAFRELFGQNTLRVTLSAPGVTRPVSIPLLGPDSIEFPAAGGVYRVEVLSVDWLQRTATLKLHPATSS